MLPSRDHMNPHWHICSRTMDRRPYFPGIWMQHQALEFPRNWMQHQADVLGNRWQRQGSDPQIQQWVLPEINLYLLIFSRKCSRKSSFCKRKWVYNYFQKYLFGIKPAITCVFANQIPWRKHTAPNPIPWRKHTDPNPIPWRKHTDLSPEN